MGARRTRWEPRASATIKHVLYVLLYSENTQMLSNAVLHSA